MSEPLAAEFESVSPEQWAAPIQAKRGTDAPLETQLDEGLATKWLYTAEDQLGADPGGLPGEAPFVRGSQIGRPWAIRQECGLSDLNQARAQITTDLNDGASEVSLRIAADSASGLPVSSVDDLDLVLHGIDVVAAPVALNAGTRALEVARLLISLYERRAIDLATVTGSAGIDPIGALARTGATAAQLDAAVKQALALAIETHARCPVLQVLAVDTAPYVDAGAGPVLEMAIAAAAAIAYLRAGEQAGLEPGAVAKLLEFRVSVSTDQFTEIAKLRALRRIWASVLEHCGVTPEERYSKLCAQTSRRMMSSLDPWVNILRSTTSAFAAAVANVDAITVLAFDEADALGFGEPGEVGSRLARTTQLVLAEEASLTRVTDPGAGSWYLESLTDELASKAWARLQEFESGESLIDAIASGHLASEIAKESDARRTQLAHRKLSKTGVNEFPLLGPDGVERGEAKVAGPWVDAATAGEGALLAAREDADFEQLRIRAQALAADGKQPRIFLACTGALPSHVAISQWAKNFFEAGGVETTVSGAQPDDEHQVALLSEHGLRAVAVCPGKGTQPEQTQNLIVALRKAGAGPVYLVGADNEQAKADGADRGVRAGVDMVSVLDELLDWFAGSGGGDDAGDGGADTSSSDGAASGEAAR